MRTARELAREYAFANDLVFSARLDVVARLREMAEEDASRSNNTYGAILLRAFADQLEVEIRSGE